MSRLVSMTEMLKKAKEGHYAVGQFNINNLEWTQAVLQAAVENNSPIILGVSEGAGKYMGGPVAVVGMVNGLLEAMDVKVPVALHLDHGSSVDVCKQYIECRFLFRNVRPLSLPNRRKHRFNQRSSGLCSS